MFCSHAILYTFVSLFLVTQALVSFDSDALWSLQRRNATSADQGDDQSCNPDNVPTERIFLRDPASKSGHIQKSKGEIDTANQKWNGQSHTAWTYFGEPVSEALADESINSSDGNSSASGGEEPDNDTTGKTQRRSTVNKISDDTEKASLFRRLRGEVRQMYNWASVKVPDGESSRIFWDLYQPYDQQIIATEALSGCTVAIITSPYMCILLHLWERQAGDSDDDNSDDEVNLDDPAMLIRRTLWATEPFGEAQQAKDRELIEEAQAQLRTLIEPLGGNVRQYLPLELTTVFVVTPAANPDYDDPNQDEYNNPAYTAQTPGRMLYPNAGYGLRNTLVNDVIQGQGDASAIDVYRSRWPTDPMHQQDDRDVVAVKLHQFENGEVWAVGFYDDSKAIPLARLY